MRARIALVILALTLSGCGKDSKSTAPTISPVTLIRYPSIGVGGDGITRGFYIPIYPGTSLETVTLWVSAGTAGAHSFRLIARSGAYDGAVIDSAKTTVTLPGNVADSTRVTFTFGNRSTIAGTAVTFALTYLSGPSAGAFYGVAGNYGILTGSAINVIQTNGTTPPLDTHRRDGIPIILTGLP